MNIHRQTNNSGFVGVFSYAGMPHEEAARNVRLFASTVMPELKKFDAGAAIDRSQMLPDRRFAAGPMLIAHPERRHRRRLLLEARKSNPLPLA